jgi:effector-binding domain-containing protein
VLHTAVPVDRSGRLTPSVEAVMEAIFDHLASNGSIGRDGDCAYIARQPLNVRHMAEFLVDRFIRRR